MIIKEIHVDGFGAFREFVLSDLRPGINIICGENEAGKSTLLKFLRYTMFGYPSPLKDRMAPLNGGNHGGRIKAVLADGLEVIFGRESGKNGGEFQAHYNGTVSKDKDDWNRFVGGAGDKLFGNIYAISLEELQGIDSLTKSGVEDKIFSIGLGIGSSSLKDVRERLEKQADELWTQRGFTKEIHVIMERLRERNTHRAQIQNNLIEYTALKDSISGFESELQVLDTRIISLSAEVRLSEDYLKCFSSHEEIIRINGQLSGLPELRDLAPGLINGLINLETVEKALAVQIDNLLHGREGETGINELKNRAGLLTVNSELLDRSESIEYLRRNLEKYKQTLDEHSQAAEKLAALSSSINTKLAGIGNGWTQQKIAGSGDLAGADVRINAFAKEFADLEIESVRAQAENEAFSAIPNAGGSSLVPIIAAVLVAAAAIYFFYVSLPSLAVISLIIAICIPVVFKLTGKKPISETHEDKLPKIKERAEGAKGEYRKYLQSALGMDESLAPAQVLEKLTLIGQARRDISDFNEISAKQDGQRSAFITEFENHANSLRAPGIPAGAGETIYSFAAGKIDEFSRLQQQSAEHKTNEEMLIQNETRIGRLNAEATAKRQEISSLIESIGASDRDAFLLRCENNDQVKLLIEEKGQYESAIARLVGADKAGTVAEYFRTQNKDALEAQLVAQTREIAEWDQQKNAKHTEKGVALSEISRIEGESEHEAVLTEIETEKAKLAVAYQNWTVNKVALELLQRVKQKYEQEKQPEVLKNSSRFFSEITNGKYTGVNANLEDGDIEIFDALAAPKKIMQLSRGTKEQLLVSLRLGFIEEYERKAEPLPLIVDDVFVHFDPVRARAAAKVFHKFAENRQILIFSCHDTTQEFFEDLPINLIKLDRNTGVVSPACV